MFGSHWVGLGGGHCGIVRNACGLHAGRILYTFPSPASCTLRKFYPTPAISCPRVVHSPIMNSVLPLLAVEETNLRKCVDEQPGCADPIRGDFDVFVAKPGKIAI